jgi:micrococcal nuclease
MARTGKKQSKAAKGMGCGTQIILCVLGLSLLGLIGLYLVPMLFTAGAGLLGWWATKQPMGQKRNWVIASSLAGLVALALFPQRAAQLRLEQSNRIAQEQQLEQQRQKTLHQQRKVQAVQREKKRLAAIATEKAKPGLRGTVIKVVDGDTIKVKLTSGKIESVRLLGIDAPELKQQHWGQQSRAALLMLINNSKVRLTQDVEKRDRNRRLLAYVWRGSSLVNFQMVRDGFADLYPTKVNVKYAASLRQAVNEARGDTRGIWNTSNGLEVSPSALSDGFDCQKMKKYAVVTRGADGGVILGSLRQPVSTPRAVTVRATNTDSITESTTEYVYYARCRDARDAGAAPIYEGQPGYRSELDRDGDGIACE